MNNGKFFAGLALGALIGSALSCFAHSSKGRKFRRDVRHTLQDWQEDAVEFAQRAKNKVKRASEDVADEVEEKVEEAKSKLNEATKK